MTDIFKNNAETIENINKMYQDGKFKKYISNIYFPFYKNFEEFSKMDFNFPLTVIVGKNGSGKSSILHALYGCPKGKSLGDFWFSTATDPIKEGNKDGKRHCFVYTYTDGDIVDIKQVLKTRALRPGTKTKKVNPDYWETSRPLEKYHMLSKQRQAPIEENVIYLDFRQELSAFDKFFYFGDIKGLKVSKKQDFIREASPKLEKVFTDNQKIYHTRTGSNQNKEFEKLSDYELRIASEILGTKYISGKIVKHHFYRNWGYSALVKKGDNSYTEAHAGSGEYAIIKLVHSLEKIKSPTLILLDEPETSLYPGAQKRLLQYLLMVVQRTKSQMVVSTHSEKFISESPQSAIKAIHCDVKTGVSDIIQNCSPNTVFEELDLPIRNTIQIVVEDVAAKKLIDAVIKREKIKNIIVKTIGCGADTLKNYAIWNDAMFDEKDKYYMLDGDQRIDKINVDTLPKKEYEDQSFIENLVEDIGKKMPFPSSRSRNKRGKKNAEDKMKYEAEIKYLRYFYNYVDFLPYATPEDIVFNAEFAQMLIENTGSTPAEFDDKSSSKDKFYELAQKLQKNNSEYYSLMGLFIDRWANKKEKGYDEISNYVKRLSQSQNKKW